MLSRTKRSRDTQSRTKKYANPVFGDWKKSVARDRRQETASLVIGKCLLCFALLCVLLASFVVTERMQISGKRGTEAVLGSKPRFERARQRHQGDLKPTRDTPACG